MVVFACRDERSLLGCAKAADEAVTGQIGVTGAPAEQWYYAGRDRLFFAPEVDMHHGRPSASDLPELPPAVGERLSGDRELALEPVQLLPGDVIAKSPRRPRER